MKPLLETICLLDGNALRAGYHEQRMKMSTGVSHNILSVLETCPDRLLTGRTKCRIVYDSERIIKVEYAAYLPKKPVSLKVVGVGDDFDYHLKYEDRSPLNELTSSLNPGEELIIVKKGFVTDCSYANLIFHKGKRLYTPKEPLLKGTHRAELLDKKLVEEAFITVEDIHSFDKVSFINAMLNVGEVSFDVSQDIFYP